MSKEEDKEKVSTVWCGLQMYAPSPLVQYTNITMKWQYSCHRDKQILFHHCMSFHTGFFVCWGVQVWDSAAGSFSCAASTPALCGVHARSPLCVCVCVCSTTNACLIKLSGAVLTAPSAPKFELYQTNRGSLSQPSTGVMTCHRQIGTRWYRMIALLGESCTTCDSFFDCSQYTRLILCHAGADTKSALSWTMQ